MEVLLAFVFLYLVKISFKVSQEFCSPEFTPEAPEEIKLVEQARKIEESTIQSDLAKSQAIKTLALHHLLKSEANDMYNQGNADVGWRQRSAINNTWKEERAFILEKARDANLIPETSSTEDDEPSKKIAKALGSRKV